MVAASVVEWAWVDSGVADSEAVASGAVASGEQALAAGFRDIRQHSAHLIRLCGNASVQCSGKFALGWHRPIRRRTLIEHMIARW